MAQQDTICVQGGLHLASTTHWQMSNEELLAAGVTPDLVR